MHTRPPVAKYLPGKGSANLEVRADRPEERPWQSRIEHQVLPISSEQAKNLRPNTDRVSSKDPSLSGQSLQTITSMRVQEEVPFDDPWNDLATHQIGGRQLDVNNSSLTNLNTVSTPPLALKEVYQEQKAIEDMSCLLEQKSINDQLTLNAFENEKGRFFRNSSFSGLLEVTVNATVPQ